MLALVLRALVLLEFEYIVNDLMHVLDDKNCVCANCRRLESMN